jgi:hypothetical protein
VGKSASSQNTNRTPVADVDHGNDTAIAITKPSEMRTNFARAIGSATESLAIRSVMATAIAAWPIPIAS